jgi:hypothetical protein
MRRIVNSNDTAPQVPTPADGMMQFTRDDLPGMVVECDIDTWFLIQRVELDAVDVQATPSAASSPLPYASKHTEACSSAPVSLPRHGINLNSSFDDAMIIDDHPIKRENSQVQSSAAAASSPSGGDSHSVHPTAVVKITTSTDDADANEEKISTATHTVASASCSGSDERQPAPVQSQTVTNAQGACADGVYDKDSVDNDEAGDTSDDSSDDDSSSSDDDEPLLQPKSSPESQEVCKNLRSDDRTPGYTASDYIYATGYIVTLALHNNGGQYVYFNSIRTRQPVSWQRNYAKLVEEKHMCKLSVSVKAPSGISRKVTGLFISTLLLTWLHSPSTTPPSKISEVFHLRGSTSRDMLEMCLETLRVNGFHAGTLQMFTPQQSLMGAATAVAPASSTSAAAAASALNSLSSVAASSSFFASMPPLEPVHVAATPPATPLATLRGTASAHNVKPPTTPSQSPLSVQTPTPVASPTVSAISPPARSPETVTAPRTSQRTTNGLLYANALSGAASKYTFYTIIDGHGFVVIDAFLRPLCRLNHLIPEVQGMVRAGILQRCTIWIPQLQVTEPRILLRSRYLSHIHYCNGDPIYNQAYSYIRSNLDHEKLRQVVQTLVKNNLLIFNKPSLKRNISSDSGSAAVGVNMVQGEPSSKRSIAASENGSPRAVPSAAAAAIHHPQQQPQTPLAATDTIPHQFGSIIPKAVVRVRGFLMRSGDVNNRVLGRPLNTTVQQVSAPLVVAVKYAQEFVDDRLRNMITATGYSSSILYNWTPILIVDQPSRLANMQWVIHIHGRHGDTATIPLPSGDALPFADSWINTVLMPDILSFIDSRWMRHMLPGESIGSFMASCSATTYSVRK